MIWLRQAIIIVSIIAVSSSIVSGNVFDSIPDGKGQIILYRSDKTSLHSVHKCFIYQITEAFSATGGNMNPQSALFINGVQPYMQSLGCFSPKTNKILNVDPGTYYFFSSNFDASVKVPNMYSHFTLPVYSVTVRAGERYFARARLKNFDGILFNEITDRTIADAYGELGIKDQVLSSKIEAVQSFDPRSFCSEQQLLTDPTASLIKQYESYKKMADLGNKQIARGNGYLFLGIPIAIAGGTTLAVIGALNDVFVLVPVGIGIGAGLGATFALSGINIKNKGKSNQRNGRYNMNEIKIKIEGSCKSLSLNVTF